MQQKTKLNKKILITGGGSGGHVSVSTAFIDALEKRYTNVHDRILYVGSDLGMVGEKNAISIEQRRMAEKKVNFTTIRAGKLQRSLSLSSIKLFLRSLLGLYDSIIIIKKFNPDIIFATGGYLSVPIALAGKLYNKTIYLHEQTAAVGLSNSIVSKLAQMVYISFKSSEKYFPKGKTLLTGNIVREGVFKSNGKTPLCHSVRVMKKNNKPIVYISGGGQGSHLLNLLVREIMNYALNNYQIILQTGDNQVFHDYDLLHKEWKKLPNNLQERMYVTKFVSDDEIGTVFKLCDIYVGRAGANTVYEMGVLKKPSIFIPIPWVTHNEQEKNARILESYGIGSVILEGEITASKLDAEIRKRINNIPTLAIDAEGLEKEFTLNAQEIILNNMLG